MEKLTISCYSLFLLFRYWYFGPLKSRWTYIRTAMKDWPPVLRGNINYMLATEDDDSEVKRKKKPVEKKSSWSWLNIFYKPKVIAGIIYTIPRNIRLALH